VLETIAIGGYPVDVPLPEPRKPDLVMKLCFVPMECMPEIWVHEEARTFWMLWRRQHMVDQHFDQYSLRIGNRIRDRRPQTVEELAECFGSGRFSDDTRKFCQEYIEFFTGAKLLGWEIKNA